MICKVKAKISNFGCCFSCCGNQRWLYLPSPPLKNETCHPKNRRELLFSNWPLKSRLCWGPIHPNPCVIQVGSHSPSHCLGLSSLKFHPRTPQPWSPSKSTESPRRWRRRVDRRDGPHTTNSQPCMCCIDAVRHQGAPRWYGDKFPGGVCVFCLCVCFLLVKTLVELESFCSFSFCFSSKRVIYCWFAARLVIYVVLGFKQTQWIPRYGSMTPRTNWVGKLYWGLSSDNEKLDSGFNYLTIFYVQPYLGKLMIQFDNILTIIGSTTN